MAVNQIHIVHVNSAYVRSGALQMDRLLVVANVTEAVRELINELEPEIEVALDWVKEPRLMR